MPKLVFEFTDEQMQAFETFINECGVADHKEVIDNSMSLLQFAVNAIKSGRIVATVDEQAKKYYEFTLPIFKKIKK